MRRKLMLCAIVLSLLATNACSSSPFGKSLRAPVQQSKVSSDRVVDRLTQLAKAGKAEEALRQGITIWQSGPAPEEAVALGLFFATTYAELGQPATAFDWCTAALARAKTQADKDLVIQAITPFLGKQSPSALKSMLQRSRDPQLASLIQKRLTTSKEPLAIASKAEPPVQGDKIGVLLPYNGKYAQFGKEMLEGLNRAKDDWQRNNPGEPVNVVIKDTAADPATDARAFAELVQNDGVMAVIGPLNKDSVPAIAPKATEWNVPVLAMASREDANASDGPFVTRFLPDDVQMCEVLVRQCMAKGMIRFADLHPQDRYGEKLSKIFRQAVADAGGRVVVSVPYKADTTDFQATVKRLAATKPPEPNAKAPFDALFVPDKFDTVRLIAPYLPYSNLVGVTLIGPSIWDGPALANSDIYTEGAFYVTTASAKSQGPYLGAQAYDALTMLLQARRGIQSGNGKRTALMRGLKDMHGFRGITGKLNVEEGYVGREFVVKEIGDGPKGK